MKRLLPIVAAFLGLGAVGGVALLVATRRMVVEGASMEPTYSPGDRVLVNRLAYARADPKVGDVVVVERGRMGSITHIKRIAATPGDEVDDRGERRLLAADEWWVLGDNPSESTDSRQLGPIRRSDISGKVLLKY